MIYHKQKNKIEYVAARLRNLIQSGELKAEMRLASSASIAKDFDVSPLTADRAVRLLVMEGLLNRIKGSGTFVLPETKALKICLLDSASGSVLFEREHIYRENTFPLIEREFAKRNVFLIHVKSWHELNKIAPDGILTSFLPPPEYQINIPTAIYRHYELFDRPLIQAVPDLEPVMREIFVKLKKKGTRRIFVFSTTDFNIKYFAETFIRWAGIYGLKGKNLKVVECHVAPRESPFDLGYKFGMSLKDVRGSMIFSTSDFRGAGILTALDERGFQPGEYDLICCNNWEAYGFKPFPYPRLTSIDFRREECLREVVELLFSSIISPNKECIRISKFPAKLKIRESGLKKDNQ